ncbi:MAG: Smr/MutS family protein [Treponema sp.]|nr:Smr/MutS family protein [Treponema sp.]
MDMGDILAQWDAVQRDEKIKAREKAKKENSVSGYGKNPQINPMEFWLNRYGTVDKDKIAEDTQERTRQQDRSYVLNMKPEAVLDLHGLHQDEAHIQLESFITNCKRRGLRKVLIIHGKGIHTHGTDPVLGEVVRRFIESDSRCGQSGHPKNKGEGGSGATWIILK